MFAQVSKWSGVLQIHPNWHSRHNSLPLPWNLCWCTYPCYLWIFWQKIWMGTRISVFSGVQVLRDQNNLTESRSRHDGDVQVMKHSIFHHCQTSNIWSRDRECLIKAYILQLSDIRSCYMRGKKAKYFQNMTNCAQTSILIVHSYANLQIFCHNKCTVAKREMQDKEFQHLSTLAIFSTTVRAWCLAQSLVQLLCTKLFWVCKSVVVWRKV